MIKVKDLRGEEIHLGYPGEAIQSHDSLKAESLSLAVVRESNGMTEDAAGEI